MQVVGVEGRNEYATAAPLSQLGRRRNVCHRAPITGARSEVSQILASSSDAVTAANATMNAVISVDHRRGSTARA